MSKNRHNNQRSGHRPIRVRGVRREVPDYRKLARALIELVQAQAEADAEALDRSAKHGKSIPPSELPPVQQPHDQSGGAV